MARRRARLAAFVCLAILCAPELGHAQVRVLRYFGKRLFKEFARDVLVRSFLLEQREQSLASYGRIEVGRFDNEILELMPYRMDEDLAAEMVRALKKRILFAEVTRASPAPSVPAAADKPASEPAVSNQSKGALLLTGAVMDFYPGNRALRALQIGLRNLNVIVQVRLQDKATGREIYREQISVDVYQVRGDAYRAALKGVAKKVAQHLRELQQENVDKQLATEAKHVSHFPHFP